MKKKIALLLTFALIIMTLAVTPVAAAPKPGDPLGWVLNSDVVAFIDEHPIRSYNINGFTYIVAEDLMSYGFNVEWRGSEAKLIIHSNRLATAENYTSTYQHTANTEVPGTHAFQYYYTDITTWIDNTRITGYNIGGNTCICMDDLAAHFSEGYVWDGNNNSLSLTTAASLSECDRNGHSYSASSCTAPGVCSVCGKISGSAPGHDYSYASCTAPGVCKVCGELTSSAPGHDYSPATCTAPQKCKKCGETTGSAAGHTTDSGKCARCGLDLFKPLTYTGSGQRVITGISLDEGLFTVTLKHSGDSNFIVVPYDGDGDRHSSWSNEIGNYSGTVVHTDGIKNGYIEVKADGSWEITISKVTETGTSNLKGNGDCVTPFFELPKGAQVVSLSYTGDSNFIAVVYDDTGDRYSSLVNEIGSYSGQTIFNKGDPNRKFCVEVTAEGPWSIDFGLESAVTTCVPAPGTSSPSSGTGSGSFYDDDDYGYDDGDDDDDDYISSEEKWSASEATSLNSYSSTATKAYNSALEYITKAMKSKDMASLYMSYVVTNMSQAKRALGQMDSLLSQNADLELTAGEYDTVGEMVDDLIDMVDDFLDEYDDISDSVTPFSMSLDLTTFGAKFINLQKLTVDLMKQFVY